MTSQELEKFLNDKNTQIAKISKEQSDRFDAVTAANVELQRLLDEAGSGGSITPEIVAAASALGTSLDSLDDAIPDAVPTPTTPS